MLGMMASFQEALSIAYNWFGYSPKNYVLYLKSTMLNEDYKDMLRALCDEQVEFLLVGAYALACHGYPRSTLYIDIWVKPSKENAKALLKALTTFGAPTANISQEDFETSGIIFQIGVAPRRIDIITSVTGLDFDKTFDKSIEVDVEGLTVRVPSKDDLIINKKATGRTKDIADVEMLSNSEQ